MIIQKTSPKVGMSLFIVSSSSCFLENDKSVLRGKPVVVVSVGRRYFEVCDAEDFPFVGSNAFVSKCKFRIEDWREETGGSPERNRLYLSEQEFRDEVELENTKKELNIMFSYRENNSFLSLSDIRAIKSIVESAKSRSQLQNKEV